MTEQKEFESVFDAIYEGNKAASDAAKFQADLALKEREKWQALAANLYQACGAYDMPERVLDVLSAAQCGEPFEHLLDGMLPCCPAAEPAQVPDGFAPVQDSYFSFDHENGFEVHATAYDAKKFAERSIDYYREDSYSEGWSENTDGVCWGLILERSTEVDLGVEVYFDGDLVDAVDYQLAPPSQAAILWRDILASHAPKVKS